MPKELEYISVIKGTIHKIEYSIDRQDDRFIFESKFLIIDKVNNKSYEIFGYYHDSWIEFDYAFLKFTELQTFEEKDYQNEITLDKHYKILNKIIHLWQEKYVIAFEFICEEMSFFFGIQQNIGGIKMITNSESIKDFKIMNHYFNESEEFTC